MIFSRLRISVFIALAALIWLGVLFFQGTPFTWDHAKPFSAVVAVLVPLGMALERVLWRKWPIQGWLVTRPDLRGTWRVEVRSTYKQSSANETIPTVVGYMGVKQTLSTLEMHLMTADSESSFIAHAIRQLNNGSGFQVIGVYRNQPNIHLRGERESEMHRGAMILISHGPEFQPATLTGEYWTDRNTAGTIVLSERCNEVFSRFEDAHKKFARE